MGSRPVSRDDLLVVGRTYSAHTRHETSRVLRPVISLATPAQSTVAVIGGGPAGLMAAEVISAAGPRVTVFERMPTLGRKFLMAGRGGLNLTHSEPLPILITRYGSAAGALGPAIEAFDPAAARAWCEGLGQATFVGTSGRVFPKAMKASPLLRAWSRRLANRGVEVRLRHRWMGWDGETLRFASPAGEVCYTADAVVLALGGASWPNLGTDGAWTAPLRAGGIAIAALRPANCGIRIAWSDHFRQRFEGQAVNRIALNHAGTMVRGEIMLTAEGIEGGAVYALSAAIRDALDHAGSVAVSVDLRPDVDEAALTAQLMRPRAKQSISQFLRKTAKLSPPAIGLLQEHARDRGLPLATLPPSALAAVIKNLPLTVTSTASITRAISSAGGVAWDELDDTYMLRSRPGTFVAGEMIDWEAPTGGYLLQACLSTGAAAGHGVLRWLARSNLSAPS